MLNPSPVHLKIGSHLGKYRILREIGEGPLAHVYVADDTILYRQVALKVLKPEFARQAPAEISLEEEVSSAAVLLHSGIVPLYGSGFDSGYHYFTMALMPNGNLRDAIQRGLTGRQALTIIGQVARALSFAHAKGVNHQGIKPENILFRKDSSAVLADFQAMKIHGFGAGVLAREAPPDPRFISPEEILNSGRQFGRADLYGLGIVFFEMLTGQFPFQGNDILRQHVESPIPQLPTHFASYQFIIDKLLRKRPTERFDANQLIQAVNRLLADEPATSSAAKVTVLPVGGKMKSAKISPSTPVVAPKRGADLFAPAPPEPEPPDRPPRITAEQPLENSNLLSASAEPLAEPTPAPDSRTHRWHLLLGAVLLVGAAAGLHLLLQPPLEPKVLETGSGIAAPGLAYKTSAQTGAAGLEEAIGPWRRAEVRAKEDFAGAVALVRSGDRVSAEEVLENLRQRFPQLPEPYNNLAAIRAADGRLDEAQRLLEEGVRAHPSYAILLENLNAVELEKSLAGNQPGETSPVPNLILLPELSSPFNQIALPAATVTPEAGLSPSLAQGRPVTAPAPSELRSAAADLLTRWAQTWSSQDLNAYLEFYSASFQPDTQATRAAWAEHRRQALSRPAWIMVALEEVHVSRLTEDRLRVMAVQDYRSDLYRDRTLKGFVLERQGDELKILREESLGIFR